MSLNLSFSSIWHFLDAIPKYGIERFNQFNTSVDRIDELFYELMAAGTKEYNALWNVVKLLVCLSHGQAATERGFSVNKEVKVENMKQNSLAAQRTVCDHVSNVGKHFECGS